MTMDVIRICQSLHIDCEIHTHFIFYKKWMQIEKCLNKACLPYQDYWSLRELRPQVMNIINNIEE